MRRHALRVALVTALFGLVAVAVLIVPSAGLASTGTLPTSDPSQWSDVWSGLETAATATPTEVDHSGLPPSQTAQDIIYQAGTKAELMPELADESLYVCSSVIASALGCTAGALFVGWEIGTGARHLWTWLKQEADPDGMTGGSPYTSEITHWWWGPQTPYEAWNGNVCASGCFHLEVRIEGVVAASAFTWSCGYPCGAYYSVKAVLEAQPVGSMIEGSGESECGGVGYYCLERWATLDQMQAASHLGGTVPFSSITTTGMSVFINNDTGFTLPSEPDANSTLAGQIRDILTGGNTATNNEVAQTLVPDWEGTSFMWPEAGQDETYPEYITRLRGLGWLGVANPVTLESNNGDSEVVASGVACTSVQTGSTIGSLTPVTFYVNATSLGSGDPDADAPACTGRLATSKTSNICTFHTVAWRDQIVGNETFYNDACNDAWSYFWANQTVFDTDGYILDSDQVHEIVAGDKIKDPDVIAALSAQDADMTHWAKGTTSSFSGFTYPFQIHFYWHKPDNKIRFDVDFKIRFNNIFTP